MKPMSGFLLGSVVGFLGSFLGRIKELFITFRSIFIEKSIVEIIPRHSFLKLVTDGKIILLNEKIRDRFYELCVECYFIDKDNFNIYGDIKTPIIYLYRGLARINDDSTNLFDKIRNTFYLDVKSYNDPIIIYHFRPFNIIKRIHELIIQSYEKYISDLRRDYNGEKIYTFDNFSITYIGSDDLFSGNPAKSTSSNESLVTGKSSENNNIRKLYPHDYFDTHYSMINMYCYVFNKYGQFTTDEQKFTSIRQFLEYTYPYFYSSENFKELVKEIKIWQRIRQGRLSNVISPITSKRCILLYGPPGTGKSFATLVATHITDNEIVVFNLMNLTEDKFINEFKQYASLTNIILFEDIDVYFEYHRNNIRQEASLYNKNITKPSTFFNLIDGVNKNINSIIVYTTNFPEKLDNRMVEYDEKTDKIILTRPGRVDKAIYFGYVEKRAILYTVKGIVELFNIRKHSLNISDQEKEYIVKYIEKEYENVDGKMTISQVTNLCYEKILEILHDRIDVEKVLD